MKKIQRCWLRYYRKRKLKEEQQKAQVEQEKQRQQQEEKQEEEITQNVPEQEILHPSIDMSKLEELMNAEHKTRDDIVDTVRKSLSILEQTEKKEPPQPIVVITPRKIITPRTPRHLCDQDKAENTVVLGKKVDNFIKYGNNFILTQLVF